MARLQTALLDRVERFSDRMLDVVESLPTRRVSLRIIDQIAAAGTSVGANVFEADEAMSRKDFCKSLGISVKELSESRFWIRTVARRGWLKPSRLADLEEESLQLRRILGTMIARTQRPTRKPAAV